MSIQFASAQSGSYSIVSASFVGGGPSISGSGTGTVGGAHFDTKYVTSDTASLSGHTGTTNGLSTAGGTVVYTVKYTGATAPTTLSWTIDTESLTYGQTQALDDPDTVNDHSTAVLGLLDNEGGINVTLESADGTITDTYGSTSAWNQGAVENDGGSSAVWTGSPGNWSTTIQSTSTGVYDSWTITRSCEDNYFISEPDSIQAVQKLVRRITYVNGARIAMDLVNGA